jgi:hypothetical protein
VEVAIRRSGTALPLDSMAALTEWRVRRHI